MALMAQLYVYPSTQHDEPQSMLDRGSKWNCVCVCVCKRQACVEMWDKCVIHCILSLA